MLRGKGGKGEAVFHDVLSVYIRITALSIAGSLVIGLYVLSYATKHADNIGGSYCLALPSIIIFLAFGTQQDIIKCWAFWRHRPNYSFRNEHSTIASEAGTQTEIINGMNEAKVVNWKSIGYNWSAGRKEHAG
ncbi:hypothetical protein AN958_10992 [Leucoagaricus sp. SymC.cos]|nr:hypothetical protein AN958_10992 [Leucoagaricus sp. SymC.cos]